MGKTVLRRCASMLLGCACALLASCKTETPLELYVDGFVPEHVRFEVQDLGALDDKSFAELNARPDLDGAAPLPAGTCGGPCRAAIFTVFVHNKAGQPEAAPVVRLDVPLGKPARHPIAYRGGEIGPGRIGRVRWLVSLYPEERGLTATLSSSVFLVNAPPSTPPSTPPATTPPAPAEKDPTP
jgi:hypothetical protein